LNGSGRSGSRARLADLRARGLREMPETGPQSVSVPGAVGAWAQALERFGTRSWAQALEPAAALAESGLPVSQRLAQDLAEEESKLREDPEAARIYLPGDAPPAAGSTLRQDDLAATLRRLQREGPTELYTGATARRIAERLSERDGFVTAEDLAAYAPEWTEPIRTDYRGLRVFAFPPNTQGVTLLEELALLRDFDLIALGHNSADYVHTVAEAIRLAFADRDSSVADPAAMRIGVEALLDPGRLRALAATIDPKARAPAAPGVARGDAPNTVYLIAVDERGNVVSMIQSLFHAFGSGIVVPGTGVVLHNRGSLFSLDPAHPNALAPRKRPYHTLCPALALRDGRPWLGLGTPGGDGQTQTLVQVLNNIVVFGLSPQDAVDAPRFRRYADGSLSIEEGVPPSVRAALTSRGYVVRTRSGWTAEFGGAQAVLIDPDTRSLRAGADRRREGFAAAY
jgi:gamma-glutamyltranspeptidase/glutathione hydrolase